MMISIWKSGGADNHPGYGSLGSESDIIGTNDGSKEAWGMIL